MVLFLKFCSSLILPPGLFIIIFFLFSCWLYKHRLKKQGVILLSLTLILYLLSTGLVAGRLMANWEGIYPQPRSPEGDIIIVLGGGTTGDTPHLLGEGNLVATSAARLLTGAELYYRLKIPLLISGGSVYEGSKQEAVLGARELALLNIPRESILLEGESVNTRENARLSAKLLKEKGYKRPILVTSAFHMARAVYNFQLEGIEVVPFPTDYRVNQQQDFHYMKLMPSAEALECTITVFREALRLFVTQIFKR